MSQYEQRKSLLEALQLADESLQYDEDDLMFQQRECSDDDYSSSKSSSSTSTKNPMHVGFFDFVQEEVASGPTRYSNNALSQQSIDYEDYVAFENGPMWISFEKRIDNKQTKQEEKAKKIELKEKIC